MKKYETEFKLEVPHTAGLQWFRLRLHKRSVVPIQQMPA